MQGLRTQESDTFKSFFRLVQEAAKKSHSVFFLAAGDGHELVKDDLEGEDLQGWLIPEEKAREFERLFNGGLEEDEIWDDFFCFAEWVENDGKVEIKFNMYW